MEFRAESAVANTLRSRNARLGQLALRLQRQDVAVHVSTAHVQFDRLQSRINGAYAAFGTARLRRLVTLTSQLQALSPLRVLQRGYALVYGPDGKLLRSSTNVMAYDTIMARLAHGSVRAKVTSTE